MASMPYPIFYLYSSFVFIIHIYLKFIKLCSYRSCLERGSELPGTWSRLRSSAYQMPEFSQVWS